MYFGELKEKSADYQSGHSSGMNRGLDWSIEHFEQMGKDNPRQKLSCKEICETLEDLKEWFKNHCNTYGMGIDSESNNVK